jgi:plastocyanin
VVVLVLVVAVASGYQKTRPKIETVPTGETQEIFPEAKPVVLPSPGTVFFEVRVFVTEQGLDKPEVKIKAGGKVTFTNSGQSDHQIASNPHPTHTAYPGLNLGVIKPFESKALVFAKAGTYGYHDHLNPQATGVVIVE